MPHTDVDNNGLSRGNRLEMNGNDASTARVDRVSIGCRYPEDRVDLLDAISKRRGDDDRATTIRFALDNLVEDYFPGATKEAA